jgi:hypothetical protein
VYNAPTPPPDELPSVRALLRSTFIAVVTAVILLVTVVLPAEYGIDPTGIGRPLGLTRMGEIKVALAREAAADAAADFAAAAAASLGTTTPAAAVEASDSANATDVEPVRPDGGRTEVVEVSLQPGEGREFKLAMKAGAEVSYEWFTDWGVVNFDLHGDPLDAAGFYHGYAKGTGRTSDKGVLTAAFEGMHGWFWSNRGTELLTVTLRVDGDYSELREIK